MTRIINFADSFVSASEPSLEGLDQENYTIANAALNQTLFTINSANYTSAFFDFELKRSDDTSEFIETGKFQLIFIDGAWNFSQGVSIGDELLVQSIDLPEHVVISMTTDAGIGSFKYSSGSMGANYLGTFKISISRIVV